MDTIVGVHKQKHEFALYVESLSLLVQDKDCGSEIVVIDEKLFHRMVNVLRLHVGDRVIFFDQTLYITAIIKSFTGKKQSKVEISAIQQVIKPQSYITFLLPLLKRDDFEAALYGLTEVGVNTIQLVFTQKTGNQWSEKRDYERAQRILIAAAEQSKNFAYPELKAPISITQVLEKYNNPTMMKIFFDPHGKPLFDIMQSIYDHKPHDVVLLIGPEGDLTVEEKKIVLANNFIFCALTPTIIRAMQAAALAAGFVRSLLI